MIYNNILVDVSLLFYACNSKQNNTLNIVKDMINRIENDIKAHLNKDGKLFLLYDAIPKNSLHINKSFLYTGFRKQTVAAYKSNRQFSDKYIEAIELFKKYYSYRGSNIVTVYNESLEADDYVKSIISNINEKENIALWSTDQDWASYISDRVVLINSSFDKPYTVKDFIDDFEFKPTIASNSLYKALFGDKSDNIKGALFIKKAKFSIPIKSICLKAIQYVSNENWNVYKLQSVISNYTVKSTETSAFIDMMLIFKCNEYRFNIVDALLKNLSIIVSRCEDAAPYFSTNEEKENLNKILHESIFQIQKPFNEKFGKI